MPIFLKSPAKSAKPHMRQVTQPLKIGDGDTAGVEIGIGKNQHVSLFEEFVCCCGCWAVCGFGEDAGLETRCVLRRNLIFHRRWHEDIALQL